MQKQIQKKPRHEIRPLLILLLILMLFLMTGCKSKDYKEAQALMDQGKYGEAEAIFLTLTGYEEADSLAEECRRIQAYNTAEQKYAAGDYDGAKEYYYEAGEYLDAQEKYTECLNECTYRFANELLANGSYSEAKDTFTDLGDFKDSRAMIPECDYQDAKARMESKDFAGARALLDQLGEYKDAADLSEDCFIALYKEDYQAAQELYKAGKYYSAYQAFNALPDGYPGVSEKLKKCKRSTPENGSSPKKGETTVNGSYLTMKVTAPKGDEHVYLKFYTKGGKLVKTLFLRHGKSATIGLSSGSYIIKAAYGEKWWGVKEMFGPDGTYCVLTNGDTEVFKLSGGYGYDLKLLASTNGNVGSQGTNMADF